MRIFPTFKKTIIIQSGAGAPTFIYGEKVNRSDAFGTMRATIGQTEQRKDAPSFGKLLLNENLNRSDAIRIPSMSFAAPETRRVSDAVNYKALTFSDSLKKTDVATFVVSLTSAGTFNIPSPIAGNLKLESWSGSGGGGGGSVNAGGGAAGGNYTRVNALAATFLQALRCVVAATAAAGVGGVTATAGAQGNDSYWSTTSVAPTSTTQGTLSKGSAPGQPGKAISSGNGGTASTTGCIGDVINSGGSGSQGNAGGGSAGDTTAGGSASGATPGTAGTVGGAAGSSQGVAGVAPGGGPGAGGSLANGGLGAIGRNKMTFSV